MIVEEAVRKLREERTLSLLKQSWSVCWPMVLIMFFLFLIGLADVYVAGRISKEIQAAYGLASQVYFLLNIIVFALTVGSVTLVARLHAAEKKEEFVVAVDSSLAITIITGVIFTVVGIVASRSIISILQVPDVLKDYSLPLLRIYSCGMIFSYFLIGSNGILRASGMIRKSLLTMAVVCVLNAVFNFILAFKTPLGFKGIAVATVISSAAGSILNFLFLKPKISGLFKVSSRALAAIIRIGWPAGALQVLWQLGAMVLFAILALLPERNIETIAAFTNGLKIEAAIFLPAFAFNMANAVVVGNLLGKHNSKDAFLIGIVTAVFGVLAVLCLTLLVMFNAQTIASMLSLNPMVVEECVKYIYIALLAEPVMAWAVILAGALNGAGDTKAVMKIVGVSVWLVRLPASFLFAIIWKMGAVGVWWAMNLSLLVQALLMSRRYFKRTWLTMGLPAVVDEAQPVIPME